MRNIFPLYKNRAGCLVRRACPPFLAGFPAVPSLLSDALLLDFDLYLARLGRFFLRQAHAQHAIVKLGADFVGIEGVWHRKAANKIAVCALDSMEPFVPGFLLEF